MHRHRKANPGACWLHLAWRRQENKPPVWICGLKRFMREDLEPPALDQTHDRSSKSHQHLFLPLSPFLISSLNPLALSSSHFSFSFTNTSVSLRASSSTSYSPSIRSPIPVPVPFPVIPPHIPPRKSKNHRIGLLCCRQRGERIGLHWLSSS